MDLMLKHAEIKGSAMVFFEPQTSPSKAWL